MRRGVRSNILCEIVGVLMQRIRRRRSWPWHLGVLAAISLSLDGTAAAPPCEFNGVDRILAVGDVHGAYDRFLDILRVAAVVDDGGQWIGGRTHLVQLGDVLDRG